jgi:hypothetical protein
MPTLTFDSLLRRIMIITRILPVVALTLLTAPAFGADANGYTAQYECRAGGPQCNVDVAALAALPCDQTITTSTTPTNNWSAINWSNRVICIGAGDHRGRGMLTVGSSGTSSTRKVLRQEDPSQQLRATISQLDFGNNSYWLVHKLAVITTSDYAVRLYTPGNATNNILDRLLVEGASASNIIVGVTNNSNTIQNSIIRNCVVSRGIDAEGINITGGPIDTRVVNNEIYDCAKSVYISEHPAEGTVVENNDLYTSPRMYTDCNGNFNGVGPCSASEAILALKAGGSQSRIVKLTHNRIWGARATDLNACCSGGGQGTAIALMSQGPDANVEYNGTKYTLLHNNIVANSQYGANFYWPGLRNKSVVGNVFFGIKQYHTNWDTGVITDAGGYLSSSELYFNTVVDSSRWYWAGGGANHDVKCNVALSSGAISGSVGAGTEIDTNGYYDTKDSGEVTKVTPSVSTRANSVSYPAEAIVRTSSVSNCTSGTESSCFLYKVVTAGTSAGTAQPYCTSLGCTTVDGSMTVQAVRGPYIFKRKLQTVTGGETAVVPYAVAHSAAPEHLRCDPATGSRPSVGISD